MDTNPIYSKQDVSYRKVRKEEEDGGRCGDCRFFQMTKKKSGKGRCELVKGSIDSTYTCNLWASKT